MTIELAPDDDYAEPGNVVPPRTYGNHAMPSGSLVLKPWGRDSGNEKIKSRTPFRDDLTARSGSASTAGEA